MKYNFFSTKIFVKINITKCTLYPLIIDVNRKIIFCFNNNIIYLYQYIINFCFKKNKNMGYNTVLNI